jgi:hypothetical protein
MELGRVASCQAELVGPRRATDCGLIALDKVGLGGRRRLARKSLGHFLTGWIVSAKTLELESCTILARWPECYGRAEVTCRPTQHSSARHCEAAVQTVAA